MNYTTIVLPENMIKKEPVESGIKTQPTGTPSVFKALSITGTIATKMLPPLAATPKKPRFGSILAVMKKANSERMKTSLRIDVNFRMAYILGFCLFSVVYWLYLTFPLIF